LSAQVAPAAGAGSAAAAIGGGSGLYVYYRVREDQLARALPVLRTMQVRCAAALPGLSVELLRRPADGGEDATLMEVYRGRLTAEAVATIAAAAAATFEQLGLNAARHVERFEPLP